MRFKPQIKKATFKFGFMCQANKMQSKSHVLPAENVKEI